MCCGLKSQEALRPIGGVARPMDMIFTCRRERGRKKHTKNDENDNKRKMDKFVQNVVLGTGSFIKELELFKYFLEKYV